MAIPGDSLRRRQAAEVIRSLLGSRRSASVAALATEQHLQAEATDARITRIRALITPLRRFAGSGEQSLELQVGEARGG